MIPADEMKRERLRAAEQALEAIVAYEDDESYRIALKCADTGAAELDCPEYHYWHWLRWCDEVDNDPELVLGRRNGIRIHFPQHVRDGGPWQ